MRILCLIILMLFTETAYSVTLELEHTVRETEAVIYKSLAFVLDEGTGGTLGSLDFQGDVITLIGIDRYVKITGGPLSMRWGFGVVIFDRVFPGKSDNWWNFHISMQSGWRFTKNIVGALTLHHWSNGLAFSKRLGLGNSWPDTNTGGSTLTLGLVWGLG